MAYMYPYGDSQQLNLSWFLAKFKELYEYVMQLDPSGETAMDAILSRFTEQYDSSRTYIPGDYCIHDGYIYKANTTTGGTFTPSAWDAALPVNDVQGLRILLGGLSTDLATLEQNTVTNVQYTPGAATANGLLRQTKNGSASTVMTVDKEPTENSQNPVKSGAVYSELATLNSIKNQFTRRFPITQVNDIADLATKTASMLSSEVGIFSGKGALGSALVGENASCTIIAKYIASSNYAVFLAFCSDTNLNGGISYGVYKTVSPYEITIFETSLKTTGAATNVYEGSTVRVTKTWNNVQVSLTSDTTDRQFTSSGWKVLATLPEGYRPSNLVQGVPVRLSSNGVDVFKTGRITTSGDVGVYIGNNDINTNYRGINIFCTFII